MASRCLYVPSRKPQNVLIPNKGVHGKSHSVASFSSRHAHSDPQRHTKRRRRGISCGAGPAKSCFVDVPQKNEHLIRCRELDKKASFNGGACLARVVADAVTLVIGAGVGRHWDNTTGVPSAVTGE